MDSDRSRERVEEKNVKNKIKVNPDMKEAIENMGGTILEITEEEAPDTSKEDKVTFDQIRKTRLQNVKKMMTKQQMLDKQRLNLQRSGRLPMNH